MARVILHSDLNNFYATCEEQRNPSLKGKFVAVCGSVEDRHGIVLAKNGLAKSVGVKTAMTIVEAKRLCPNLVCVEADLSYYLEVSKKVKKIYEKYTDRIESFGIDEAWLDVTNSKIFGSGVEIANKIREEVKALGLTVSVGVSFNKIFAKLGSDLKKPDATTEISLQNYKEIVWNLDCAELLMVGKKTAQKLRKYNIYTIGDIAKADKNFLVKTFGKWGSYLYDFANGYDNSPVKKVDEDSEVKSIGNSMTCYRDLTTLDEAKIMFTVLCESVSARVIDANIGDATSLSISIRDENLSWITRQQKLDRPSVLSEDFFKTAIGLFSKNYDFKTPIRSLGVSVSNFIKTEVQTTIFEDEKDYEKRLKLAKTVGGLREKYGTGSVVKGVNLKDRKITREDPKNRHVVHPEGFKKKP